jgi:hypothetical protein
MYFDSFISTRNTVIGLGPPFLAATPRRNVPIVIRDRRDR